MTPEKKARIIEKVLNFIAYQSRTEKEVHDKIYMLLKRSAKYTDFNLPEVLDELLQKVLSMGFIDDAAYAQMYLEQKLGGSKPLSKLQAQRFLMKKGIARDTLQQSMSNANYSSKDEEAAILKLLVKKLKSVQDLQLKEKRHKLARFLLSKGYSPDAVFRLVDTKTKIN